MQYLITGTNIKHKANKDAEAVIFHEGSIIDLNANDYKRLSKYLSPASKVKNSDKVMSIKEHEKLIADLNEKYEKQINNKE